MPKSLIFRTLIIVLLLLLIPFFGNIFVEGWNWTFGDFIFAAIIFFITVYSFIFLFSKTTANSYKFASAIAVLSSFALFWGNAAAGMIGDSNPANHLYPFVVLIEIAGVLFSRFKPQGMARAMYVTALAIIIVPLVALVFWGPKYYSWAPGVVKVFAINVVFMLAFIVSGRLFKKSGSPS